MFNLWCLQIYFLHFLNKYSVKRHCIDYPYTASTCDNMYCRQRRHLYYGGENLKYCTSWPPPPQFFLPRRAALTTHSNGTQSAHKRKGWEAVEVLFSYLWSALSKKNQYDSITYFVFKWRLDSRNLSSLLNSVFKEKCRPCCGAASILWGSCFGPAPALLNICQNLYVKNYKRVLIL
jgi:hypothetical protein